jgi:fermentation-respiration switch protein FrsA (DUF1100 family)
MLRAHATAACLLLAASGCAAVGTLTAPLEHHILYQPSGPPPDAFQAEGLTKEDVWFETADRVKLHAWYCPVENPVAVVLFSHGNGGNLTHRAERLRLLTRRLGVTVLAFDYRGYGRSEGDPSEAGLYADARAARKFLAAKAGVPESAIVLYGQSLGGAVAVDLAAADGARGLILESSFTKLADVANRKFPLTPPGKILKNQFASIEKLPAYRGPLLVLHGEQDSLVPIAQGKALYAAANGPKSFVAIPGADHNWDPTLEVIAALDAFVHGLPLSGDASLQATAPASADEALAKRN